MNTVSKDIIVLTPNGRRQKVHCSPDTTILQVLEDACAKHGFEATQYNLKHHNHILDLTNTVRFSNLPNKATLEMVEAERERQESTVTVGLLLEDGERRTAVFPPNTSLLEMISSMAPNELKSLHNPTIMFMRQEVTGVPALQQKTLRQLGLLGGRAILRLLSKADKAKQANVSTVYRVPISEEKSIEDRSAEYKKHEERQAKYEKHELVPNDIPGPSSQSQPAPSSSPKTDNYKPYVDPLKLIKEVKKTNTEVKENTAAPDIKPDENSLVPSIPMEIDSQISTNSSSTTNPRISQKDLERRLKIEEEVGAQKAIVFKQPEEGQNELSDLPDDFYDLTIEEVRKLYKDLQQKRIELENTPLMSNEQRQEIKIKSSEEKVIGYKNVVVRIQFPDQLILQGVFTPSNTIEDVKEFVKDHLDTPNRDFDLFTTPRKETLDPKTTLLEARFVPCVHMHFKWCNDKKSHENIKYLKEEIHSRQTSSDAASILASKYRAPQVRRKHDDSGSQRSSKPSTSVAAKKSKVPSWFK